MAETKARLIAGNFTTTGTPADVTGSTGAGGGGGGVDSAGTLSLVGIDGIFREHNSHVTSNITIDSAYNAIAAGPIFIDSGYTITINDSATLVIA
jgi:hypothetical protein